MGLSDVGKGGRGGRGADETSESIDSTAEGGKWGVVGRRFVNVGIVHGRVL